MPSLVVGTAGHIDHGKSSLVLAMTGTDPDRLKEEKARGITIDLGFAHWTRGDVDVAFVDVPGHERFVRNMLAGVGGIDAVLLVVAADESVMPQTREHFQICRLLGISHGLVALTKCDLVDAEMLGVARMEVAALLEGSSLAGAPILPVSARTGEGIEALGVALSDLARRVPARGNRGAVRLPVDRAFSMKGFGTVVTGTLVSGRITQDQELSVLPSGRLAVKVRGVQVHGSARKDVEAGHRTALNLGGVEVADVPRGQVLAEPETLEVTRILDAAVELLDDARPLKHGTRVRVHQGTAEVIGRVGLAPLPDGDLLLPGARGFVRLRLEQPVAATRGDRLILRAYSPPRTIAGGVVLDPQAPRSGLRATGSRARFEALELDASSPHPHDRALAAFVAERGAAGLPRAALVSRGGVLPADAATTAERMEKAGLAQRIGGSLFAPGLTRRLAAELAELVRGHHKAQPLSEGLPREEARERLFAHADPALFDRVLADLAAARTVTGRERLVAAGHAVALSSEEAAARERIADALQRGGLTPPEPAAIAADARVGADVTTRVLSLLVRQKSVARLDTLYFDVRALERLKLDVKAMKEGGQATVDVAAFKDRYGLTRKYAIPLLEYLDRERVTRRQGDVRVIL